MALAFPASGREAEPRPVPGMIAAEFGLSDPWFAHYSQTRGIPVVGSAGVDAATLAIARRTLSRMLATAPNDVARRLRRAKFRVVVSARGEPVTAIPAVRDRLGADAASRYWAGFGATRGWPLCVANEANLADGQGDENILVYSLATSIAELALEPARRSFGAQRDRAYAHALTSGLWANSYARATVDTYWGEGVQSYFNANREGGRNGDGIHGHVNTRRELKAHDPQLYRLIEDAFGPGR